MLSKNNVLAAVCIIIAFFPAASQADGKIFAPRHYTGSLEELSQEAIIIFHQGNMDGNGKPVNGGARQDLILKIGVKADQPQNLKSFGWVVPFPSAPRVAREDAKLFKECFDYVEARRIRPPITGIKGRARNAAPKSGTDEKSGVEVISCKTVGAYDVAVLREQKQGALNKWLDENGFQGVADGDEIVAGYREKGYVFACMKVSDATLAKDRRVDLHPLRFSFKTGGIDGIYFPMKLTGLQKEKFDVNLYVFYGKWINDRVSRFGYVHRGFRLKHRDWDSEECDPNAGKAWSDPENDPYLSRFARRIPTLVKLFQKLHPGERYYLTQIYARRLDPADLREWRDDLWLFPYYTNPDFVPFDARKGGVASRAYPSKD